MKRNLPTIQEMASWIDHALLHPALTDMELEKGCLEGRGFGVASVCVKPCHLKRCAEILSGSRVLPSTVIGFPHGSSVVEAKLRETELALQDGCREVDLVVNIGKVCSNNQSSVVNEVRQVLALVRQAGAVLKVIFENAYLNEEQKIRMCRMCAECQVDYAKTSTGFAPTGATVEDVRLMRKTLPAAVKIKASGGIHTLDRFLELRSAGADRIGASKTAELLRELEKRRELAS